MKESPMPEQDSRIRVSVIKAQPAAEKDFENLSEQAQPLSAYMYMAGLLVSLSGIYAVTYDLTDSHFALLLRVLVIVGYGVSYLLRRNRIDLKQYQAPLLVVFATAMYFIATAGPSMSTTDTAGGLTRPYQVQVIVVWIAVLQSFTLTTDSAILFACVPSMALIGIMSSGSPDTEVQNSFLVFLASTTFLMVHENHLRAKAAMAARRRNVARTDTRLFSGELILVTCCVVGTMLLANVIAVPMQIAGKALIPINPAGANTAKNNNSQSNSNVLVDEQTSMDLGTGPASQSDVALLEITASKQVRFWRGTTYDYYTGHRFEDHGSKAYPIVPNPNTQYGAFRGRDANGALLQGNLQRYDFDPLTWDKGNGRMDGAIEVTATVKILAGTMTHLYGVPSFKTVYSAYPDLLQSDAGSLGAETPMVQDATYRIVSLMPNEDSAALKRTGTDYSILWMTALEAKQTRMTRL
jgi:hypothetical protein